MPQAFVGRCRIYYEVHGDPAAPALVLIRGLGRSGRYWGEILPLFARDLRVLVMDNRGVGRSDATHPPYSIPQLAEDVVAVMDAVGIERAHVFGMSLGGMVAQQIALKHPQRLRRLVLGCTTPGGLRGIRSAFGTVVMVLRASRLEPDEAVRFTAPYLVSRDSLASRPQVIDDWIRISREEPRSRRGLLGQLLAAATHDCRRSIAQIAAPTLVITGAADRLIPVSESRFIGQRIPGAELAVLPGVGHDFTTDQPERAAAAINEFLLR